MSAGGGGLVHAGARVFLSRDGLRIVGIPEVHTHGVVDSGDVFPLVGTSLFAVEKGKECIERFGFGPLGHLEAPSATDGGVRERSARGKPGRSREVGEHKKAGANRNQTAAEVCEALMKLGIVT